MSKTPIQIAEEHFGSQIVKDRLYHMETWHNENVLQDIKIAIELFDYAFHTNFAPNVGELYNKEWDEYYLGYKAPEGRWFDGLHDSLIELYKKHYPFIPFDFNIQDNGSGVELSYSGPWIYTGMLKQNPN